MTKSAEDAEREVEASRDELDRTMEALKERMTPGQLLDEAMRTMGGAGNQILARFVDQAKENPMPLAVMGVGLAWLMTSNRRASAASGSRGYEPRSFAPVGEAGADDGGGPGIGERMHDVADRASGAAASAREKIGDAAAGVAGAARDAKHRAANAMHLAADRAGAYGEQTRDAIAELIEREPLLIGGAGLLAGLALGAALPATAAERRYIGPMAEKAADKTRTLAQEGLEKVKDTAAAVYGGAKDELERRTEGPGSQEAAETPYDYGASPPH